VPDVLPPVGDLRNDADALERRADRHSDRLIDLERRRLHDELRISELEDAVRSLQEGESENLGCALVSIEELTKRLGALEGARVQTGRLGVIPCEPRVEEVRVATPERIKDDVAQWAKAGLDSPLLPISKGRTLGSLLAITKDSTEVVVEGPMVWDFKATGVSGNVHEWKLITTTQECQEHKGDPNDLLKRMAKAHEIRIRAAMRMELQWLLETLDAADEKDGKG
jgi:hypothetical protein